MGQNDNTAWMVLGLIVVVFLLIGQQAIAINIPQFNGTSGGSNQVTNNNYYTNQTPAVRPNLAQVFLPYFLVANSSTCTVTHNGQWIAQSNAVGCFNMRVPISPSVCTSAVYLAAAQQCSAVGATSVCNPANVGCSYS